MRPLTSAILAFLLAPLWTDLAGSGSGGGVSNTAGSSSVPSLALDRRGRAWIAWEELGATGKSIRLRHWDGSAWVGLGGSETDNGLSGGGSNEMPSLALDSADQPVAAYRANFGIFVRHWDGSAWVPYGNSDSGFGISDSPSCFTPKLRLDASNRPVVAWMIAPPTANQPLPTQIYLKRWNGSAWEELGGSASGGGISNALYFAEAPDLALDAAGNPVVVWMQADIPGNNRLVVKRWNGSVWEEVGGTGDGIGGPGSSGTNPSIALDSTGKPYVAWHEYSLSGAGFGEIYLRRWDGTAWTGLGGSDAGGGISAADNVGARYPSLKMGPSDRPIVAWQNGPIYSTDEIYIRKWDGSAWVELGGSATGGGVSNTPAVSSGAASLALTAAGDPAVAWMEGYSNIMISTPEIFYRELSAPPPPPLLTVAAMTPAPGSTLNKVPRTLTVTLSAAPDPLTVNGVSVTVVRAGKDKILGTADDVPLAPEVSVAGSTITVNFCHMTLQKDKYRLRVKGVPGTGAASAVRDALGNLLDGEFTGTFPSGNGASGGDFVADFTLTKTGKP